VEVNPIGVTVMFVGLALVIFVILFFLIYREGKSVQQLRDLELELNELKEEVKELERQLREGGGRKG
jgi:Na+-transporting methylmalonyl-CoA/oxaloacetate decarboxylase gamma subunit